MTFLPVLTRARSFARRTGLIRVAQTLAARLMPSRGYEERFARTMLDAVRPGDCVWDVGANVGLYTEFFSDRAGPFGSVVAFEPVPQCFEALARRVAERRGVILRQHALGELERQAEMAVAEDPLGATHSLVTEAGSSQGASIAVQVRRGDDVARVDGVPPPTIVKVDVEGFELDVLKGMRELLARPGCRAVFVEVHFALLEARGTPLAAKEIVALLKSLGYRTRWIDFSHLAALR